MEHLSVGDLVVLPEEPSLGFGRLERIFQADNVQHARVLLYDNGRAIVRRLEFIARCPPGVWDRTRHG